MTEPMDPMDAYGLRVGRELLVMSDGALRPFDAVAIAGAAAGARRRAGAPARWGVLLAFGLVAALASVGIVVGSGLVSPRPTMEIVLPADTLGHFEPTGRLHQGRVAHTAILLADGRVLIVGGGELPRGAPAEVWDPVSGAFTTTGIPVTQAVGVAIRLDDGRVLVMGGSPGQPAQLWDPADGTFTNAGTPDGVPFALSLQGDGRVRAIQSPRDQIWDETTLSFSPPSPVRRLNWPRPGVELEDGSGYLELTPSGAMFWDATTDRSTPAGTLTRGREAPVVTPLGGARLLVTGGTESQPVAGQPALHKTRSVSWAEIWDSATRSFLPLPDMLEARAGHTATALPDGRVLLVGGYLPGDTSLISAELFIPDGPSTP